MDVTDRTQQSSQHPPSAQQRTRRERPIMTAIHPITPPADAGAASDLQGAASALIDVLDVAEQLQGRRVTEDGYRTAVPVAQQLTSAGQERPAGSSGLTS